MGARERATGTEGDAKRAVGAGRGKGEGANNADIATVDRPTL